LLAQHALDPVGKHDDAVGALAVGEPGAGIIVDESVQAKDLVAVATRSAHGLTVQLRGSLAELGDGELNIRLALADAVVCAHECRARAAPHIVGCPQNSARAAASARDDDNAPDKYGCHDDEQRDAAGDHPRHDAAHKLHAPILGAPSCS